MILRSAVFALALLPLACSTTKGAKETAESTPPSSDGMAMEAARTGTANLESKSGSTTTGTARFESRGNEVHLVLEIQGATPGIHAAHLHEKGDCSAEDATSAGGHWNPTTDAHGKWESEHFHLGDIGNIEVGEDGTGRIELTTDRWELGTGGPTDVAGHAVIVHSDPDDFVTQPTGNAGGRVACGVVTVQ
jgi:Cu-Zn family superoxide dismutase